MSIESSLLRNRRTGEVLARRVVRCDTFFSRARGLTFRRALGEDEVYIFSQDRESVTSTTIHMLFVFFPIAVVWLDSRMRVVDTALAKPWRPYYAPRQPAQFFLEGHPSLLEKVQSGDEIVIETV
jgi:uncharacterized membrane protein (UPF0127 family)